LHFAHLGFLFLRLVFQTCDGFLLLGIKRTWFELGVEVPFALGDEGSFFCWFLTCVAAIVKPFRSAFVKRIPPPRY
jgi:hypothetical protein